MAPGGSKHPASELVGCHVPSGIRSREANHASEPIWPQTDAAPAPLAAYLLTRLASGLTLLWSGRQYARELSVDPWQFACDIRSLHRAGLCDNDLRWLTLRGWVRHGEELTACAATTRAFRASGSLVFGPKSAFTLTDQGLAEVRVLLASPCHDDFVAFQRIKPVWDSTRHLLTLGGVIVKEFKLPSRNQETILSAFHEEDWPPRIDDPLPRAAGIDPRRRLNDAIKGLNRNQRQNLIRFHGDGTAHGVLWQACESLTPLQGTVDVEERPACDFEKPLSTEA